MGKVPSCTQTYRSSTAYWKRRMALGHVRFRTSLSHERAFWRLRSSPYIHGILLTTNQLVRQQDLAAKLLLVWVAVV